MKNPLTPAGIEPATFRFVAQHLNQCATAVPGLLVYLTIINDTFGVIPLDKRSARRGALYLKTNYIHERQTSVPLVGFELVIAAIGRLQTDASDRATTRIQK